MFPSASRGGLYICLINIFKFLASFIERFRNCFLLCVNENDLLNVHTLPNAALTMLLLSFCHSILTLLLSFFVIQVEQNTFVQILKCFSFCLCIRNNVNLLTSW